MKHLIAVFCSLVLFTTFASAQANYRIKPGDTLSVEVLEDSQLNRSVLVLPDGTVSFPFAGSILVGGRTVGEVEQAIRNGISGNFAVEPTVFVTVASVRPEATAAAPLVTADTINIYLAGEVGAPGLRTVTAGTTFLQALAQSGGFSQFAATKRIQLRRTDTRTGQQAVYIINYRAIADGAEMTNNFVMQEGDVILIPERRLFE